MAFTPGHIKAGGRRAGTPNKKVAARQRLLKLAHEPGVASPLDVMLQIMCLRLVGKDFKGALEAATLAAPYLHPKLQATDIRMQQVPLAQRSDADLDADIAALRAKLAASAALSAPARRLIDATPEQPAAAD
jgi:hypothetical protein